MHRIERIEIKGFWDTYDIDVKLYPDVTFFIGTNGTGKTTLINIIAASLLADLYALDKLPFQQIKLHLTSERGQKQPMITVVKDNTSSSQGLIVYSIVGADGREASFHAQKPDSYAYNRLLFGSHWHAEPSRGFDGPVALAVQKLLLVSWLSVHRATLGDRALEERQFESPVDQKLHNLSNALVRHLSTLSKQKDDEVLSFQQNIFLSFLDFRREGPPSATFSTEEVDEQQRSITDLFKELHIPERRSKRSIDWYFKTASKIINKIEQDDKISQEDFLVLSNFDRIGALVQDWQKLREKLSAIFSHRDRFVSIVNTMFNRKQMEIIESNELIFTSRTGKRLTPQMLSSGEKQLLILLIETLVQNQKPFIFIADEPEISLHVSWQEQLIASIRELNSSAQIIAATHSPDIVGALSSRAIDMESLIR